jgi:DNA-binding transcriptional regulator LsrR (DeoR family)
VRAPSNAGHRTDTRLDGRRPAELAQAAAIARRYYLDGASKSEIGAEFGLSRFKVARILDEALATGLVRIDIRLPVGFDTALAQALQEQFGLRRAVVVDAGPDPDSEATVRRQLARATAALLDEVVTAADVLGIGYGRTLTLLAEDVAALPPCPVVQLTGALFGVNPGENSVELVRQIAARSGGPCYSIYAPQVLPDARTAEQLRQQREVGETYAQFDRVTKAVVAVGSWTPPRSQLHDSLSADQQAELAAAGVCAEVCAVLLDADGHLVAEDFTQRCISIGAAQLHAVPDVIAVAGGAAKAQALRAVIAGGYASSVVVDTSLATAMLA